MRGEYHTVELTRAGVEADCESRTIIEPGATRMTIAPRLLATLALLGALGAAPLRAETVLHVVPQSDISVLDPHITMATVTRMFGMMIYDRSTRSTPNLQPQPQMVGAEKVSDDRLTYDFTLRDGLKWNSGEPVTGADAVASIARAGKQDPLLQLMLRRKAALEATGREQLPHPLRQAVPLCRAGARGAQRADPARAGHQGRGRRAAEDDRRLRPVPLPAEGVQCRRQAGVRAQSGLPAAQREGERVRRRQARAGGSRRVGHHPGSADAHRRAGTGRGRSARPAAA